MRAAAVEVIPTVGEKARFFLGQGNLTPGIPLVPLGDRGFARVAGADMIRAPAGNGPIFHIAPAPIPAMVINQRPRQAPQARDAPRRLVRAREKFVHRIPERSMRSKSRRADGPPRPTRVSVLAAPAAGRSPSPPRPAPPAGPIFLSSCSHHFPATAPRLGAGGQARNNGQKL